LNVHRDFLAQVTLNLDVILDDPGDTAHLVFGKIFDADHRIDLGLGQDRVR